MEAGNPLAQWKNAGMETTVIDEILRQHDMEIREAVRAGLAGEVKTVDRDLGMEELSPFRPNPRRKHPEPQTRTPSGHLIVPNGRAARSWRCARMRSLGEDAESLGKDRTPRRLSPGVTRKCYTQALEYPRMCFSEHRARRNLVSGFPSGC